MFKGGFATTLKKNYGFIRDIRKLNFFKMLIRGTMNWNFPEISVITVENVCVTGASLSAETSSIT